MTMIARMLSTAAFSLAATAFLFQVAAGPVTGPAAGLPISQTRA